MPTGGAEWAQPSGLCVGARRRGAAWCAAQASQLGPNGTARKGTDCGTAMRSARSGEAESLKSTGIAFRDAVKRFGIVCRHGRRGRRVQATGDRLRFRLARRGLTVARTHTRTLCGAGSVCGACVSVAGWVGLVCVRLRVAICNRHDGACSHCIQLPAAVVSHRSLRSRAA
jgi:hypothetical protein